MKNFEPELPQGYEEAASLDIKNPKTALVFNLVSILISFAIIVAVNVLAITSPAISSADEVIDSIFTSLVAFFVLSVVYLILHELVHGAVYKAMTGQRLTFGMNLSCAFCGVPNIYVYRRCAFLACIAPLAVFTALFVPLLVYSYLTSIFWFLALGLVFSMHIGGCIGDIYVASLLLFRLRDSKTLMKDTGPTMTIYIPIK